MCARACAFGCTESLCYAENDRWGADGRRAPQDRTAAAAAPRSARQRCQRNGLQRNYLAKRAAAVVELDCLRQALEEQQEEREREADAEAARTQKRARIARWGAEAGEAEEGGEAEEPPAPELPLNAAADKALRTARTELLANGDLQHLATALRWYYYPGDGRASGNGPLPHKVDVVRSGCVAAQLAHHPEDLDRRACPAML